MRRVVRSWRNRYGPRSDRTAGSGRSDSCDPLIYLLERTLAAAGRDGFTPVRFRFILADYIWCIALSAGMVNDIGGETARAELSFKVFAE